MKDIMVSTREPQFLPKKWHNVPLRKVLTTLETGSRPPGGAMGVRVGVPSLSAEHFTRSGGLEFNVERFISQDFYSLMRRGQIKKGDVLVVKDGATTGKTAFVADDFPLMEAAVNEHVFICRPNTNVILPKFLFYFLWGPMGQIAIRSHYRGAAVGGINQDFADGVLVPVPSLPEQKRIVAILSEQLAVIKKTQENIEIQFNAANTLISAYLREIFCDPQSSKWAKKKVGSIASLVIDGPHITPTYERNGIPFLTVRNIVNRRIDLSNVSFISDSDHARFVRRGKPECGDILYTKDGTLGVPCLVEADFEFSYFVSVALIKLIRSVADPQFIVFALDSPPVIEQVKLLSAGAGLKHMVLKSIRALEVPLPPLCDQQRIAAQLIESISGAKQLQQSLEQQLTSIAKLPAALIQKALKGDI